MGSRVGEPEESATTREPIRGCDFFLFPLCANERRREAFLDYYSNLIFPPFTSKEVVITLFLRRYTFSKSADVLLDLNWVPRTSLRTAASRGRNVRVCYVDCIIFTINSIPLLLTRANMRVDSKCPFRLVPFNLISILFLFLQFVKCLQLQTCAARLLRESAALFATLRAPTFHIRR